jgi:hypothetical protein
MANELSALYQLREIITRELAENERDRLAIEEQLRKVEVRRRELFHGLVGVNAEIERLKTEKGAD